MRRQANSSAVAASAHGQREKSQLGFSMWSHLAIPLSACVTSSPIPSESGISLTAMNEQKTVHRDWPLIFNSVAALDMLLFSFFKQVGSRGHTNPHGYPHFSTIGDQVEVRVRRVMERGH